MSQSESSSIIRAVLILFSTTLHLCKQLDMVTYKIHTASKRSYAHASFQVHWAFLDAFPPSTPVLHQLRHSEDSKRSTYSWIRFPIHILASNSFELIHLQTGI